MRLLCMVVWLILNCGFMSRIILDFGVYIFVMVGSMSLREMKERLLMMILGVVVLFVVVVRFLGVMWWML